MFISYYILFASSSLSLQVLPVLSVLSVLPVLPVLRARCDEAHSASIYRGRGSPLWVPGIASSNEA